MLFCSCQHHRKHSYPHRSVPRSAALWFPHFEDSAASYQTLAACYPPTSWLMFFQSFSDEPQTHKHTHADQHSYGWLQQFRQPLATLRGCFIYTEPVFSQHTDCVLVVFRLSQNCLPNKIFSETCPEIFQRIFIFLICTCFKKRKEKMCTVSLFGTLGNRFKITLRCHENNTICCLSVLSEEIKMKVFKKMWRWRGGQTSTVLPNSVSV